MTITSLLPTLYFVRSGWININYGRLGSAGNDGVYWLSIASAQRSDDSVTPSAYYLHFYNNRVGPMNGPDNRWYGYPLRCLPSSSLPAPPYHHDCPRTQHFNQTDIYLTFPIKKDPFEPHKTTPTLTKFSLQTKT